MSLPSCCHRCCRRLQGKHLRTRGSTTTTLPGKLQKEAATPRIQSRWYDSTVILWISTLRRRGGRMRTRMRIRTKMRIRMRRRKRMRRRRRSEMAYSPVFLATLGCCLQKDLNSLTKFLSTKQGQFQPLFRIIITGASSSEHCFVESFAHHAPCLVCDRQGKSGFFLRPN